MVVPLAADRQFFYALLFIFEDCKQEAREEIREMEDPVTIN